jgi:dTDP-glucose 4,6-dehydratase
MKLLVTGGAGFIGSNFIHYWLKNHPADEIVNFDKLTYAGNLENLRGIEKNPNYTFIKGDIAGTSAVETAVRGMDVVVNFAAESHVDRSILGPAEFINTNVVGTQVLLDAALKASVKRFHHISTDEVFGQIPLESKEKFNEQSKYNPRSPYAASKAASDHLVNSYYATYGLPITITNCSNNYGPYMFPEKFLPLAITNLLEGKNIPVYAPGNQVRDWLYVEDHCSAIELVLEKGKIGETYCVGGMDEEISNLEIARKIVRLMRQSEDMIQLVKDRPGHDVKYAIDSAKIKTELGWRPQVSFEDGLKQTIDWYMKNESWWKPLKEKSREYFKKQYEER